MSYEARGVYWDGTNDQARRAGDFTGNANGRKGMIAFWWQAAAPYASREMFFYNIAQWITLQWNGGQIELFGRATDNTLVLVINNVGAIDDQQWHHVAFSWDLDLDRRQLRIDGAVPPVNAPTLPVMDLGYSAGDQRFGYFGGGSRIHANMADFYLNYAESLDLDQAADLAKLIGSNGGAVDYGDSGQLVTGNLPLLWLSRRGADTPDDWVINKGSGGGLTLTGALEASATNPPVESAAAVAQSLQQGVAP